VRKVRKVRRRIWWVTRPSRDLHDIEEALKYFHEIAGGKKWRSNRDLHKTFEENNPATTRNVGKVSEGGGGRTWAAWLRMWGLWYDENHVTLTPAGKLIVETKNPETVHKQIVHLIMRFQITNAYLEAQGQDSGFEVFPFRFLLELLLHRNVGYLTLDEMGLFVLDVKAHGRLDSIAKKIVDWRRRKGDDLRTKLIARHMKDYGIPRSDSPSENRQITEQKRLDGYWRSVKDIAHTLASNLSYITEIEYGKGRLSIRSGDTDTIRELLGKYKDIKFIPMNYNESIFLKKFGTRYDRRKASEKETKPMSKQVKQARRIKDAVSELRKTGRFDETSLVADIKRMTNYHESVIEKILSEDLGTVTDDEFVQHYMECATNGAKHREFEDLTRTMFTKMGFPTQKRKGPKIGDEEPGEIDGLILNTQAGLSGILECKAGKSYALSKGDAAKMQHVYIKHFGRKTINGVKYQLDFFTYVVGKKASSLANFSGIMRDTNTRGSIIHAKDLLLLYCMYLQKRTCPIKIWGLFKTGKLITRSDIISICD